MLLGKCILFKATQPLFERLEQAIKLDWLVKKIQLVTFWLFFTKILYSSNSEHGSIEL